MDYRYFPDPDLLPVELTQGYVEKIRATLPELPDVKKERFVSDYNLSESDAEILVAEKETATYFEEVSSGRDAKIAANWVIHELFAVLNKDGISISNSPIKSDKLGELVELISDNTISNRIAKDVFQEMVKSGKDASQIVEEGGLRQITNSTEIEASIDSVINDNQDQVDQYKTGNQKVIGWLVGQVIRETKGKANPKMVSELLHKKLDG